MSIRLALDFDEPQQDAREEASLAFSALPSLLGDEHAPPVAKRVIAWMARLAARRHPFRHAPCRIASVAILTVLCRCRLLIAIDTRENKVGYAKVGQVGQEQSEIISVSLVVRRVVASIAPEETAALEGYLATYEADPRILKHLGRDRQDATGFGGSDSALTPYILGVASSALSFLAAQFADAIKAEAGNWVHGLVAKLFRRKQTGTPEVTAEQARSLTSEQLEQVREAAYARARSFRLAESTARNLADAVVGSLAVDAE